MNARWTLDGGEAARSGRPVVSVQDGTIEDGLERRRAHPDHRRVGDQIVLDDLSVAGKVMEADEAIIERRYLSH